MKLLIVESPAKAKTIGKYLGGDFSVRASIGHVRDLPKSNNKAIDIEHGFVPRYEVSKGKETIIADLKKLSGKASEVYLATDPDREGEAIAWHIAESVGLKEPKRIVFHEITKEAVEEAIEHPRHIDMKLKEAQEARRVLDRLVGYDLSGLIWKKVRYGLSAGRVQSPALRIIMEREREIRAFVSEKYWVVSVLVKGKSEKEFTIICEEEPRDEKVMEKIVAAAKSSAFTVLDVTETRAMRSPRAPFTTSTLQQAASSRLGFSPSRTMAIAQKLYESGLITYMRTDSTNIGTAAQSAIVNEVRKMFGERYASPRLYKTKSKSAQEAHEAIRPTNIEKARAGYNEEQKKLYELIRERALASQMADAETLRTKITCILPDKDTPSFSANGTRVVFDGWLKGDPEARGEDVELPKVTKGEKLSTLNVKSEEKATEPPDRYTEAGIVKELEKREIGRPSTYASILKTLNDRGYVEKQGRTLHPTEVGEVVSTFLEKNFEKYINDTFTAKMENDLDDIALGKAEYLKTLKDFYKPFHAEVKSKDKIEKLTNLGPVESKWRCPKCGGPMIWKLGRGGKFMSCERFPNCEGARTAEGIEMNGPKETGELCPECGGKLVERVGKFGSFIACSNYPKCKFVKRSPEEEARMKTGVTCPVCKRGELMERRGRFGPFYACSNYPKCPFTMKSRPTGRTCSYLRDGKPCGALMMQGTKTIPERCSNKECPMHNPHKIAKV